MVHPMAKSIHMRFVHLTTQGRLNCTLARVVRVPMFCGLIDVTDFVVHILLTVSPKSVHLDSAELLLATEIALVEEGAASETRQTFAPLDHHQGPHIALKVGKAGSREAGGKDLKQGQRLGWKEDIHCTPPGCIARHTTGEAYLLPPDVV